MTIFYDEKVLDMLRELISRHDREVDRITLTLLPYSIGPHEITLEAYPGHTTICFRAYRISVPRATLRDPSDFAR